VRNLADLNDGLTYFNSRNEPGQWVCWDFNKMRIVPTHYTVSAFGLKSWVVERSLDGRTWTVIDQKKDNLNFHADHAVASFSVSKSTECRFIRLTQTDEDHWGDNDLHIHAVDFFGTLIE
jgi:hypothetical protein